MAIDNEYQEVFSVKSGYDHKTNIHLRYITIEEIPSLRGEYWMLDTNEEARRVRTNSVVKTWKRDPNRFECSFRYGMYEHFRLNTQQLLDRVFKAV